MASTRGTSPKPIPQFVTDGLTRLGYRRMAYDRGGVPLWRHPAFPDLFTSVVVPNLPGSDDILVEWAGRPAARMRPEQYLQQLEGQLEQRRMAMPMEQGGSD
jgi:hypothetical protein